MKNYRTRFKDIIISALFVSAILISNLFISSACGVQASDLDLQNPAIEEAVRAYNGLTPDENINADMLNEIEEITIVKNPYGIKNEEAEKIDFVDIFINSKYYSSALIPEAEKDYFESVYLEAFGDNPNDRQYLEAFYALQDKSGGKFYVLDPYSKSREIVKLNKIIYRAGLADDYILTDNTFDVSSLSYMKNLKKIRYSGVELVKTDDLKCSIENIGEIPALSNASKYIAAIFEKDNAGKLEPQIGVITSDSQKIK